MKNVTDDPTMRKIIQTGTALPAGFLAASLQAWSPNGFAISWMTAVVCISAALVVVAYWQLIFSSFSTWMKVAASALVVVATISGFLYPIRYVAPTKYPEITAGFVTALIALSCVAAFLWCCRYIFNDQEIPK